MEGRHDRGKKALRKSRSRTLVLLSPRPRQVTIVQVGLQIFTCDTSWDGIYKARILAKEFIEQKDVDFNDIFAPVAIFLSVRLLLKHAYKLGYIIDPVHIKSAFLCGDLEELIYMRKPKQFVDESHSDWVCHLERTSHGLEHATFCETLWEAMKRAVLMHYHLTRSASWGQQQVRGMISHLHWRSAKSGSWASHCRSCQRKAAGFSHFQGYVLGVRARLYINIRAVRAAVAVYASGWRYSTTPPIFWHECMQGGPNINGEEQNDAAVIGVEARCQRYVLRNVIQILYLESCTRPNVEFAVEKLTQVYAALNLPH